ncbi:hypothetical protein IMPERIA89_280152 [Imperialibacter sp. 89]|nr:hypothetical protein IMPERIA89_280152 [Imperialibacter sp. 89]
MNRIFRQIKNDPVRFVAWKKQLRIREAVGWAVLMTMLVGVVVFSAVLLAAKKHNHSD